MLSASSCLSSGSFNMLKSCRDDQWIGGDELLKDVILLHHVMLLHVMMLHVLLLHVRLIELHFNILDCCRQVLLKQLSRGWVNIKLNPSLRRR